MANIKRANFFDTTHGTIDISIEPDVDFYTIYDCVCDSGIDISSSSLLKCVDLYLRVLVMCNNAKTEDDIKSALYKCICYGGFIRTGIEYLNEAYYYRGRSEFNIRDAFVILLEDSINDHGKIECLKIPEWDIKAIKDNVDYIITLIEYLIESITKAFKSKQSSESIRFTHTLMALDHTNETLNRINFDLYCKDYKEADRLYIESNFVRLKIDGGAS